MYLKYLILNPLLFLFIKCEVVENHKVENAQNQSVFEKKLYVEQVTRKDILNNYKFYYENTSDKRVLTNTLGFLETSHLPHNPNYDNSLKDAITFAQKFTMLSPFQLEIRRKGSNVYEISGTNWLHNNKEWIENLSKSDQKELMIVPIIKFTDWNLSDFVALVVSDKEISNLGLEVLRVAQDLQVHGLILDILPEFYGKIPRSLLSLIIQEISARLRYDIKAALLLIPSKYANEHVISRDIFEELTDFLNYIIFETYNSYVLTPGSNSSISTIENYINYLTPDPLIKRNSIIIGINFFGNKYSPSQISTITSDEYIEILENNDHIELKFDEQTMEHYFEIEETTGKHIIYYPTLFSIHSRVRLANKLGVGLAIVKLGQGLDYFYDVI